LIEKGARPVSEDEIRKQFAAATTDWVEKSQAVTRWYQQHFGSLWPESGESPPPQPKFVNREALDELERLRADEEKAHQKWARINRQLLGLE
jgi:hypothetical protein